MHWPWLRLRTRLIAHVSSLQVHPLALSASTLAYRMSPPVSWVQYRRGQLTKYPTLSLRSTQHKIEMGRGDTHRGKMNVTDVLLILPTQCRMAFKNMGPICLMAWNGSLTLPHPISRPPLGWSGVDNDSLQKHPDRCEPYSGLKRPDCQWLGAEVQFPWKKRTA